MNVLFYLKLFTNDYWALINKQHFQIYNYSKRVLERVVTLLEWLPQKKNDKNWVVKY